MRAARVLQGPARVAYAVHACDAPGISAWLGKLVHRAFLWDDPSHAVHQAEGRERRGITLGDFASRFKSGQEPLSFCEAIEEILLTSLAPQWPWGASHGVTPHPSLLPQVLLLAHEGRQR